MEFRAAAKIYCESILRPKKYSEMSKPNKNLILVIDTTGNNCLAVFLYSPAGMSRLRRRAHQQSEKLLPAIQEILRRRGAALADLRAIFVATGAGSYTSLKVGAAVANALGYALDIPVLALPAEACQSPKELKTVLDLLTEPVSASVPSNAAGGCGGCCAMCGGCGAGARNLSASAENGGLPEHFVGALEPKYAAKAEWER